jgi:hypothetical protein
VYGAAAQLIAISFHTASTTRREAYSALALFNISSGIRDLLH